MLSLSRACSWPVAENFVSLPRNNHMYDVSLLWFSTPYCRIPGMLLATTEYIFYIYLSFVNTCMVTRLQQGCKVSQAEGVASCEDSTTCQPFQAAAAGGNGRKAAVLRVPEDAQ